MKVKPVVPRELARRDVDEAIDRHLREGAEQAALGFVDALEQAYLQLGRQPASGSLRHARALGVPGLRSWPLRPFPHLAFYLEREDHVDVWRVLHGRRDIPAWLREAE